MAKYDPLREHLARLDEVVWAAKLDELENILGVRLPMSAREHRTWWANSGGSLVHQNAWLDAGWRVDHTDLRRDLVVFRRLRISGTSAAGDSSGPQRSGRHQDDLDQLRRHAREMREPVNLTVRAEWTEIGIVAETPCNSRLVPALPGLYRLAVLADGKVQTFILDSGDLGALHRDLQRLSHPEGQDVTRIGEKLGLAAGTAAMADMVTPGNIWLIADGRGKPADLASPGGRELAGRLLCLHERQNGRKSRFVRL